MTPGMIPMRLNKPKPSQTQELGTVWSSRWLHSSPTGGDMCHAQDHVVEITSKWARKRDDIVQTDQFQGKMAMNSMNGNGAISFQINPLVPQILNEFSHVFYPVLRNERFCGQHS